MTKFTVTICVLATWLVGSVADADLICQQRKSKRIVLAAECPNKFHPIFDLGPLTALDGKIDASKTELNTKIRTVETNLSSLTAIAASRFGELESEIAEVAAQPIAADAVDSAKVKNNSLALVDMAPSLMLPFPSNVSGSHERIVSAEIDMNTADGNNVGVVGEAGQSWLRVLTFDTGDKSAEFVIDAAVFDESPRCVAGLTDSESPDSARSLALEVGEDPLTGRSLRVRVIGPGRQLDVMGTVICTGAAKL